MHKHWKFEFGSYYFMQGSTIITMCEEVGIAYSLTEDHPILHKIGQAEAIKKWYDETMSRYATCGYQDLMKELSMIQGKFEISDLNELVEDHVHLSRLLKKMSLPTKSPL